MKSSHNLIKIEKAEDHPENPKLPVERKAAQLSQDISELNLEDLGEAHVLSQATLMEQAEAREREESLRQKTLGEKPEKTLNEDLETAYPSS
ncbi:MAG: hypothetical protein JEZ06_06220, partial [Anaerolineaceae bacterium]|nr:hypothetical protein [Anaerolineaceae bacterium]